MVTIHDIEQGLADYLESELIPKLPKSGVHRVVVGTVSAILVKRIGNLIDAYKSNPLVAALGIMCDDKVDIDIVMDEIKRNMPEDGLRLATSQFGKFDMIIRAEDVDVLHRCILRRAHDE